MELETHANATALHTALATQQAQADGSKDRKKRHRKKTDLPPVHPALADYALIDGPQCAAAAGCSISEWRERVRTGEAPAPVMRTTRCTRWRIVDIKTYLEGIAQSAAA